MGIDPGFGPYVTTVTVARAFTYTPEDHILVYGGAFPTDWPRPIRWALNRVSPKLRDFLEMMLFDLSETAQVMYGYRFGPAQFTVFKLVDQHTFKVV